MIDCDDADLSPPGITTAAHSGFEIELRTRANYRHVCPNNFVSAHKSRAFGDTHWESADMREAIRMARLAATRSARKGMNGLIFKIDLSF